MIPYSLYFVFFGTIGLILYCFYRSKELNRWDDWFSVGCLGVMLGMATGLLFAGCSLFFAGWKFENNPKYRIEQKEKLVAFQNKFGLSGSFFLGSGNINGAAYYYYLIQKPDGAVQMHNVVAQGINVYQSNNQEPCVVWVSYYNPQYAKWFPCQQNWGRFFIIPTNSINYNFNINLENQ